jgi:hypothetical protein
MKRELDRLPGGNLVAEGVRDLELGVESVPALLVAVGAPRLRRLGLSLPASDALPTTPEIRLYRLLGRENPRGTHSQYNALVRRLVSLERALELRAGLEMRAKRSSLLGGTPPHRRD